VLKISILKNSVKYVSKTYILESVVFAVSECGEMLLMHMIDLDRENKPMIKCIFVQRLK
jgi:hypothetical protein